MEKNFKGFVKKILFSVALLCVVLHVVNPYTFCLYYRVVGTSMGPEYDGAIVLNAWRKNKKGDVVMAISNENFLSQKSCCNSRRKS